MIKISAFADEISPEPAEQVTVLEKHGVKYIEFRSIHGTNVLDLSDAQHAEFRGSIQAHGIGLSAVGSPIGKIKVDEPFEPHLARFDRACWVADFFGTPNIRVFSFYPPAGEGPAPHRDEVLRRMSILADLASKRGLKLMLENEKGIYGDVAARVLDVLEAVNSPALAAAFDPANFLEVGQEIAPAWELLKSRVQHFHVKDYDRAIHRNVPTGQGEGQIPRLLAEAVAAGYDGFAVLEPHLVVAAKSFGFTGPERFGDAATALKAGLDQHQVAYA